MHRDIDTESTRILNTVMRHPIQPERGIVDEKGLEIYRGAEGQGITGSKAQTGSKRRLHGGTSKEAIGSTEASLCRDQRPDQDCEGTGLTPEGARMTEVWMTAGSRMTRSDSRETEMP
jgi:hypothetical protein